MGGGTEACLALGAEVLGVEERTGQRAIGGEVEWEPGPERGGLCKLPERTGLYLAGPGEPLKNIRQDGDVIKLTLYRKKNNPD